MRVTEIQLRKTMEATRSSQNDPKLPEASTEAWGVFIPESSCVRGNAKSDFTGSQLHANRVLPRGWVLASSVIRSSKSLYSTLCFTIMNFYWNEFCTLSIFVIILRFCFFRVRHYHVLHFKKLKNLSIVMFFIICFIKKIKVDLMKGLWAILSFDRWVTCHISVDNMSTWL